MSPFFHFHLIIIAVDNDTASRPILYFWGKNIVSVTIQACIGGLLVLPYKTDELCRPVSKPST